MNKIDIGDFIDRNTQIEKTEPEKRMPNDCSR